MAQFILSKRVLKQTYDQIKDLGVTVSYSHKTNEEVGEVLEEITDSDFNIHSFESLNRVKDKSRVWYFPLALKEEDYKKLKELGVNKFVIDNDKDLKTLIDFCQRENFKIDLLLRMKLRENTIHTGKFYVFGMNSNIVNGYIRELKDYDCINKIGIHVHRKSQNVAEWSLIEDIAQAVDDDLKSSINIIDIGGGIPTAYKNTNDKAIIRIRQKIKDLVDYVKINFNLDCQVIAEPGRALAAPCIKLKTKILLINGHDITVDASVYNTAIDTVLVSVKLLVENEIENTTDYDKQYLIRGCTPCSMDILRYRIYLNQPKVGDYLYFINAGAYNYHSDFCDLKKIETIIVDDF